MENYKINNKIFDKDIIYDIDADDDLLNKLNSLNINIEIKNKVIIRK